MRDALTDAELDTIQARANAAHPGPWEWERWAFKSQSRWYNLQHSQTFDGKPPGLLNQMHAWVLLKTLEGWGPTDADAAFIAAAREDVPALVAEVRRLRAEVERSRAENADLLAVIHFAGWDVKRTPEGKPLLVYRQDPWRSLCVDTVTLRSSEGEASS